MKSIRVLLVDDHAVVRLGSRLLLRKLEGLEVVAETGDGREALELIRAHRAQLMERLDLHSVAEVVHFAIQAGLIQPGEVCQ